MAILHQFAHPHQGRTLDLAHTCGAYTQRFADLVQIQFFHKIELEDQRFPFGELGKAFGQILAELRCLKLRVGTGCQICKPAVVVRVDFINRIKLLRLG